MESLSKLLREHAIKTGKLPPEDPEGLERWMNDMTEIMPHIAADFKKNLKGVSTYVTDSGFPYEVDWSSPVERFQAEQLLRSYEKDKSS